MAKGKSKRSAFKSAVQATAGLEQAWESGLRALEDADRQRIRAVDSRRLTGSICLDLALAEMMPNDPRWDYGIGHRPTNREEMVYWIEVHPATEGDIVAILRKHNWLAAWLKSSAPELNSLHRNFVWVSSNKTSFTQSSPQGKRLAQHGLMLAGRHFKIPNVAGI